MAADPPCPLLPWIQLTVTTLGWGVAFWVAFWAQKRSDRRNQLERCMTLARDCERMALQYWATCAIDGVNGKAAVLRLQSSLQKLADVGELVADKLSTKGQQDKLTRNIVDCRQAAALGIEGYMLPGNADMHGRTIDVARRFGKLSQFLESIYEGMAL